jgi:hypothetical protein
MKANVAQCRVTKLEAILSVVASLHVASDMRQIHSVNTPQHKGSKKC